MGKLSASILFISIFYTFSFGQNYDVILNQIDSIEKSASKVNSQNDVMIDQLYFGSSSNPLNGLTVSWRSLGTSDSIMWGYTTSFEMGNFAGIEIDGYAGHLYNYEFPKLKADSTIYYKIYDSLMQQWTEQKKFRCSSDTSELNFSFLVMGDSQSHFKEWQKVSNAANKNNTDFALFTGDIVEDGSINSYWNGWFKYGAEFLEKNLVYHTLGNHDCIGGGDDTYLDIFTLPENPSGNEKYYYFTFGNALFICLNSEESATGTNPDKQYNWLLNVLEENKDKTWKFAWYHRPFCSAGPHQGELYYKMDMWFKAFDEYGVDMMFSGHEHMYERSKPVQKNRTVVLEYGSNPDQGRCQIISGGAGASLHTASLLPWLDTGVSTHNYCKVEIEGNNLTLTAFDENNNLIDSLSMRKNNMVSINNNIQNNKTRIYPNPADDLITIKGKKGELEHCNLISMQGQNLNIMTKIVRNDMETIEIDVSAIPSGMYFLKVGDSMEKVCIK